MSITVVIVMMISVVHVHMCRIVLVNSVIIVMMGSMIIILCARHGFHCHHGDGRHARFHDCNYRDGAKTANHGGVSDYHSDAVRVNVGHVPANRHRI